MALPASPSVVVLENDQSIYTPNTQSSVVGIVGFADKGPANKATLITSQNQLLDTFGKPSSDIPGQGIEGALEILEATNQVYFVRAVGSTSAYSLASATAGFCPAVAVSAPTTVNNLDGISVYYAVTDNDSTLQLSGVVTLASSTENNTNRKIFLSQFAEGSLRDSPIFAKEDTDGNLYLVGRYAGNSARLQVSGSIAGLSLSALGVSGQPLTTAQSVIASGGTASVTGVSSLYVKLSSNYPGAAYNFTTLRDGTVQGISIEVSNESSKDLVTVNSDGSERENFIVDLSPAPSDNSIETLLTSDQVNNTSEYIFSEILASGSTFSMPNNFADKISAGKQFTYQGNSIFANPRFVKLIEGTYSLSGGNSGYNTAGTGLEAGTVDKTALIGESAGKTGIYGLDDDGLQISIAIVPGITDQAVQNALITLAESSKNFIALVSPSYGLNTVQEAVDWMNGRRTRTSPINSSYAAVYWPWVQVFNYFAGADEWYDPAIFAARQYVFTDSVADPWFAPAGFRRGRLTKPTDVEVGLNQGDKDTLYSNNINPVSKEQNLGISILGQKTAQRTPSALDRVNVRRLMIFVRKSLLQLGKPFQFEPNDSITWELVQDAIVPFIDDLLARRAIVEGAVKCDETTNTAIRVDRNELWCSVTIKPTKAAETVVFEVNLTNQSATVNG